MARQWHAWLSRCWAFAYSEDVVKLHHILCTTVELKVEVRLMLACLPECII